jgi:hypothetical protein
VKLCNSNNSSQLHKPFAVVAVNQKPDTSERVVVVVDYEFELVNLWTAKLESKISEVLIA